MSINNYDRLIAKFEPSCRFYEILASGIFDRKPKDGYFERTMTVCCARRDAELLLDLARTRYPEAASEIARDLAASREL